MKAVIRAFLLLVACIAIVAGIVAYAVASRGLSTRVPPSGIEETVARVMRSPATPRAMRSRQNPAALDDDVMRDARTHFADHCASCHANDGSGQTAMGQSFYPPAPDMRKAPTQDLSDGEVFSIIEHGIRLTGMPAWGTGTPEGELASWGLVHFIRHLPKLTPEELAEMEALNPRSPQQFREDEETRRFLAGEDAEPSADAPRPPDGHVGHK